MGIRSCPGVSVGGLHHEGRILADSSVPRYAWDECITAGHLRWRELVALRPRHVDFLVG